MSEPNPKLARAAGLRDMLRTLGSANYRLFFAGQGVSLIGTWMQQVAMSWLVYRLTGSELLLGVVSFTGRVPIFVLTPVAGVLADRWDRRRILVFTQTLSLVQALVLAGLTLSGMITVPHIIALSLFVGLVNALDIPTRQTFIMDMIENKDDIGNAIALNSSLINGARLVGPALAGGIIAAAGEGVCFLINAATYLAVIVALLAMRLPKRTGPARRGHMYRDLREGARYVFGFPPMRAILGLVSVVSLMGMSYAVLMPVFAKDIFHGGPHTLGFLMSASGLGALAGALYLASRRRVLGLDRLIIWACLLFGAGLVAFSFSRQLGLSMALLALAGFGMMIQLASSNTMLQLLVEDDKRGRLMSFYTMSFMGMAPFGALLAGVLAGWIGAPGTVMFGGACSLIGALVFALRLPALRRSMRPVLVEKGIIEQPTVETEAANISFPVP